MASTLPRALTAAAAALALALAHGGAAFAQETEETGSAASDEGSVVEGQSGGFDIGQGATWLGIGALVVVGLALAIAATNSSPVGTTGTSDTNGPGGPTTTGTGGTN
jgi:hypothetical protein